MEMDEDQIGVRTLLLLLCITALIAGVLWIYHRYTWCRDKLRLACSFTVGGKNESGTGNSREAGMNFAEIIKHVTVVVPTPRGEEEVSFSPGDEYPALQLHDDFAVVEVTMFGERCRVKIPGRCYKIRELFVA